MDVTHILAFGKLSFVHVTVDTFSQVIIASARSGEAIRNVIQHLFQCFSQIGLPKQIKTDNAPAYTSAAFKRLCQQFSKVHSTRIPYNPQGLRPNALWQMDVTHIPAFGKLSFVHVTVDTFSHVIIASARSGEAARDVIQHLFQCFSQIGLPEQMKTDNALAYTSAAFKRFCQQFSRVHSTGIPYNPQGQAIVERAHQTLKNQIAKLKQGEFKYSSPHHVLHHAL